MRSAWSAWTVSSSSCTPPSFHLAPAKHKRWLCFFTLLFFSQKDDIEQYLFDQFHANAAVASIVFCVRNGNDIEYQQMKSSAILNRGKKGHSLNKSLPPNRKKSIPLLHLQISHSCAVPVMSISASQLPCTNPCDRGQASATLFSQATKTVCSLQSHLAAPM